MAIFTSKTFMMPDGDQAVLLPDQVAFYSDIEVTITRSGDVLTVRPTAMQPTAFKEVEARDPT